MVKGNAQQEGVDYVVFSPVVMHTSICVLLTMVAHFDLVACSTLILISCKLDFV